MSPSASEAPRVLILGAPGGERTLAFQRALAERGRRPATVVTYSDALEARVDLARQVVPGGLVRLEAPSEDPAVDELLIRLGGGAPIDLAGGRLAPGHHWHAGLRRALRMIDQALGAAPAHRRMQRSDAVLAMCDKDETHRRLERAGVPVPPAVLGAPTAADALEAVRARGWTQVFVKPRYGSSAAGAMALRWSGARVAAITTAAWRHGHLVNSRRPVRLNDWRDVHRVLDAVAPQGLHVQRWIPKASWGGGPVDLRVVVVGGQARHTLARIGTGPMTNLHLGGRRGDLAALRADVGSQRWAALADSCELAVAAFPGALYGGVDVMLSPGWRDHHVLEVNAFGDFHEGVLHRGQDTYTAELEAAS
jgi:glutathione synthase/RimK-type ligase-like ATP-grasp enzyme